MPTCRARSTKVDAQINEIEELDKKKAKLLARKEVIEQLQANRSQMVHLFDSLVRTIPDGVVLTSIKQEGEKLTLEGRSQSNARVSTYMRNLEGSGWMTKPDLSIIEAKGDDKGLPFVVHPGGDSWPIRTRPRMRTATACPIRCRRSTPHPQAPQHRPRRRRPRRPRLPPRHPHPKAPRPRRLPPLPKEPRREPEEKDVAQGTRLQQHRRMAARVRRSGSACWSALLIFGLLWWLLTRDKGDELEGLERTGNRSCAASSRPSRAGPPISSRSSSSSRRWSSSCSRCCGSCRARPRCPT